MLTVTVPGVEVLATGTYQLSSGEETFTPADLAAAVEAAASCPALSRPVLKLGHVDPRFDGEPAVGHLANLRASGDRLTGDLAEVPAWLAEAMPSAWPNRSIEAFRQFACAAGHVHPFAVTGLALLGTTAPGVGVLNSLDDVASLYQLAAKSPPGTGHRMEITTMPARIDAAAESVIAAAVARGAFGQHRAQVYRDWLAEGGDPAIIEAMPAATPEAIAAGAPAPVAAAAGPADLVAEMRASRPGLVAAAMAEDPAYPRLFGDSDLPLFCASDVPVDVLRSLPWQLRRPVAFATTRAKAFRLIEDTDDMELAGMAKDPANKDYISRVRAWLIGNGQFEGDEGAALEGLHKELFGPVDAARQTKATTWPGKK